MNIHIRTAAVRDAANLAALSIQVWLDTYATTGLRYDLANFVLVEFTEAKLAELIADSTRIVLVAELEGHLIGYVDAVPGRTTEFSMSGHQAEIDHLYIQERFTRMGVGAALMERMERRLFEEGFDAIWLSVWVGNDRARAFYAKRGFVDCGKWMFPLGDGEFEDRILVLARKA